jgi:hypothetical protein
MDKHLNILTELYKQYLKQRPYKTILGGDITSIKQPSNKIIKRMIKFYWVGLGYFTVDDKPFSLVFEYMEKAEYVDDRNKFLNDFYKQATRIWFKRELDIK